MVFAHPGFRDGRESVNDMIYTLGAAFGHHLFTLTHPETAEHPSERNVMFRLRNATNDELHDGQAMWQGDGHFWPKRLPPSQIPAKSSAAWVGTNGQNQLGGSVMGSMWYKIGKGGGQINIDFGNHNNKANVYKVYTNNGDKYSVYWNGNNDFNSSLEVMLGYKYHDREVIGPALHNTPTSLVHSNTGTLFCFFHGDNTDQTLWSTSFNGQRWSQVQEAKTSSDQRRMWMKESPAAVDFRSLIYCFFQGSHNDELWGATFDGTSWLSLWQMGNSRLTSSPAAIVYRNKLYCLWQGAGSAGTLWYRTLDAADGAQWSDEKQIRHDRVLSEAPAPIVWHDKLYVFFQGANHNGSLHYLTFDGNTWSEPADIKQVGMSRSPAPVVVNDKIRIYHQSYGETGRLWFTDFEGKDGDTPVVCLGMSHSPSVVRFGDWILCLHQGWANNKKLFSLFLPLDH